ncbi:GntR family transcriptional regulator [Sphingomonas colocasiae]|uniref:GntR family transcriptional regulator n=1 Tax=Sphingomonas colocasiae TaxID=1848973 RepID=A0ABS7PPM0_9SPHN|nr:GntR family transcriptional regulator [Sphingomonas colocasiae]MBY8823267.1 GntR family transcriptional regulator [Sphingomonas colocasiae]
MNAGLTMERVYDALRHRIVQGELAPGTRLDPARLAQDLNASATPVRDALFRLLGERVVDARPQDGFHVTTLSESALRDLHGWSLDLLAASLRPAIAPLSPGRIRALSLPSDQEPAERIAQLFDAIAESSGNAEHRRGIANANARLHAYRRIEPKLIPDTPQETDRLISAWNRNEMATLRSALAHFHKRRVRLVPHIVAVMQRQAGA